MIELQDQSKKFNEKTVINGLNFQVREGEIFGYLGPNGAGKTTTMRIILGLLRPTSGKALVFGDDLGSNDGLRRRVGILLYNDGLYDGLSAYENLDYYAQLCNDPDREEKIKNLLDFAGLTERKDDKVGTFSKGMNMSISKIFIVAKKEMMGIIKTKSQMLVGLFIPSDLKWIHDY